MAGYTRQSTFTDGDVITAAHSNDEFDQLVSSFDNATGHTHDGTSAEGAPITVVGPAQDVIVSGTQVLPKTNNTLDVGSATFKFKDGYFAGDVIANNIASTSYNSDIVPDTDDAYDLGSVTNEWKDLYIDGVAYVDSIAMPTTTVTDILDEDTMSSDSATALATQQSIKAYVDSQITANNELGELTDVTITTVADNEVLAYDSTSSEWINQTPAEAGLVSLTGTETLTNKTLTSAVLDTGVSGTAILDEDTMVSDSDTHLATQQSIKAYVDAQVGGVSSDLVNDTTPQLGGDLDTNGNSIVLPDSSGTADRIKLGDTTDTSIYHQGTTTFIQTTTGNTTVIDTASLAVKFGAEFAATFTGNSSVDLYYDNSKKFETTTDGVTVTGKAVADELDVDNITINGNTISSTDTDGDITLDPNGTGNVLLGNYEFDVDQTVGASEDNYVLTYDDATGHISLEAAAASGISDVVSDTTPQLGGDLDSNGQDILMADDDAVVIGTDTDLTIVHDSGVNNTLFKSDSLEFKSKADANLTFKISPGATKAATLYYQGSERLAIESGTTRFTGGINADTATIASLAYPTSDGTSGQVLTTNGSGTLSFQNVTETDPSALAFAIALG